ncbi:MAG: aquaporin [Bacteroidales bacterium]|jgi:aquaporin Z|nr:aquaporin [Bacteroidales bacterium]MBP5316538.1 aquaporin [Bacteroidales bacterium]MBQ4021164.1 aquaporin [Bacteroidales bacterium]MBR3527284.1 aquaporin [Bacteroidales bacterium]MCR5828121.1 aquaporin [Bacteroidales bacterium]
MKKYFAECVGTFVLTLLGCGTAMFLGCNTPAGVVGTAVAFGLSVIAMAYTIGGVSGCHINPAITFGVALAGRMSWKDAVGYWCGQIIGAIIAGAVLLLLTKVVAAPDLTGGLGTNGVANAGGVGGALLVECLATFLFVLVVLGTTDSKVGAGNLAGLAIGLTLILIHLVCINLTGTSVNPARSIGPALFAGGEALKNVWVFIVAPMVGGALAVPVWKAIAPAK